MASTSKTVIIIVKSTAINQSLRQLAISQKAQMITAHLFSDVLLGKNEQVSFGDCGGVGATFGSFSLPAHGRRKLAPDLTALFGLAVGHYEEKGAFVSHSYTFAAGLRYDPTNMGSSRPYSELGGAIAPNQHATYARAYMSGDGVATGVGSTKTSNLSIYARAGWVWRVSKRDEIAGGLSVGHCWQTQRSYQEDEGAANPFNALYSGGTNQMSMVGISGQYTHLLTRRIEVAANGSVSHSFGSHTGIDATIDGFGQSKVGSGEITYFEPGARVSFRVNRRLKIDTFVDATIANHSIGTSEHGGLGINLTF